MTAIIPATTHTCRVLADGTLRFQIDVEPVHKDAAFALMGSPGRALAVAAIKDGAGAIGATPPEPQEPPVPVAQAPAPRPAPDKPRASLARDAALMCASPDFHRYLQAQGFPACTAEAAAEWMRSTLSIESRSELDDFPHLAARFHERIRIPYRDWLKANP